MKPALFTLALALLAPAAKSQPLPLANPLSPAAGTARCAFKSTPQGELAVDVYFPPDWKPTGRRPAIVLFFGGGFNTGTPAQFAPQARYFASRGMVAFTPEYRIRTKHGTTADKSIEDAKSAIRWVRANAARLGIDPARVAAGGGSSGGTCAALAAWNTTFEPPGEDASVSARPNALVLFNPALGFGSMASQFPAAQVATLGPIVSAWKLFPGGPSAILFYGAADRLIEGGREFARRSLALGNRAEFYTAAGQGHGFFNPPGTGAGKAPWYELTVWQADVFLASLGYLDGPPAIARPAGGAALKRELDKPSQ